MDVSSGAFWAALGSIVLVNLVLSGDNAVVIAMAAGSLPAEQQRRALVWGTAGAIALRFALTAVAVSVLRWPYVKLVAAVALFGIGVSLLRHRADAGRPAPRAGTWAAIGTILLADLVMSLDNVLAMVAAAQGDLRLLAIGLALSVPLIAFGSGAMLALMRRWPVVVTLGAALLGALSAQMLLSEPALRQRSGAVAPWLGGLIEVLTALAVVVLGRWRRGAA